MAVIDTSLRSPPAFLEENFLNRDAVVAVSKGDAFKHRAYDMTRSSKWVAIGSVPSVQEEYDARLFKGATQFLRTVDAIMLLGHNLKRFLVEYSSNDGGAWTTFPGMDWTGSDFSGSDLIASIAGTVDVNRVRVRATEIQSGTDKEIGDIVVSKVQLQLTRGFFEYRKRYEDTVKSLTMADGSKDYTNIFRSDDSFQFYRASVIFSALSQSQRDLLFAIKSAIGPFLWMPEPGNIPGDVFLSRIVPSSYEESYFIADRSQGHIVRFDVEEIGGG